MAKKKSQAEDFILTEHELKIAERSALENPVMDKLLNHYNLSREEPFSQLLVTLLSQLKTFCTEIDDGTFNMAHPQTASKVEFMTKVDKIAAGIQTVYRISKGGKELNTEVEQVTPQNILKNETESAPS